MTEREESEPFVKVHVQEVEVDDYIRRGAPDHFRRVRAVRPRQGGGGEIVYDDGAKASFGSAETVEVARAEPKSPPGSLLALRAFGKSLPKDMPENDLRLALVDKAVELGIPDPEGMVDALSDIEAQSPVLKALGPFGLLITVGKMLYQGNQALNPRWARPPKRSNRWGLADEASYHERKVIVELAPTSTAVFDRVRREIEFFEQDKGIDAGWGLSPWLSWDGKLSRVAVNIGQVSIGCLTEPDSAQLGSAVRNAAKAPVGHMWLHPTGEIETWIRVPGQRQDSQVME